MKMKRFSLLAALATLVTVGSVYATWDYITGGDIEGDESTLGVSITGKTETTDVAGALEITSLPTLTIDHTGDYVPALSIVGDIEVDYTPAAGSQVNAVICTITVDWQSATTAEFKNLFTFTKITETSTAGTEFTVSNATLATNIKLNSPTALTSPALYDAYAATLNTANCGFVVTATAVAA